MICMPVPCPDVKGQKDRTEDLCLDASRLQARTKSPYPNGILIIYADYADPAGSNPRTCIGPFYPLLIRHYSERMKVSAGG